MRRCPRRHSRPRWAAATRPPWPPYTTGETVLDLGSGGGRRRAALGRAALVRPGRAYGLDMTDEMLDLARANAARGRCRPTSSSLKGYIEEIPLADDSVDVVISNCVINLSADKPKVFARAARVLRPGGRFAVTDVIADPDMDEATRRDMQQWTGCIAGALTREEFEQALAEAGLRGHRGSTRPTACTSTPHRRSSGHARTPSRDGSHRADTSKPAGAVPGMGARRTGPLRTSTSAATPSTGARGRERARATLLGARSLMVAEERISTQFCGLVLAQDDEEEGSFLSTQLVDEIRHMQFYARFQNEVVADPAAIGATWNARARCSASRSARSSTRRL